MNRPKVVAIGSALAILVALGPAEALGQSAGATGNFAYEFALIGDVPYAPTTGTSPNKTQVYPSPDYDLLISDINAHNKVLFTAHIGDIKAGDTRCDDIVFTKNVELFNSFRNPSVFIPGDNEWTDCHRINNGGFNPVERLARLREVFYPTEQSLGQRKITLTRESSDPGFADYRENVMWRTGVVLFVGINQPGSNNDHLRVPAAPTVSAGYIPEAEAEYAARNAANIAWIRKAFARAQSDAGIRGIVIMQQANVFERFLETGQGYTRSGYEDFVNELRTQTVAYGKPVVLVGGDTHTVRIDKPMTDVYPAHSGPTGPAVVAAGTGNRIQNFTRVEVFGGGDVHWIRVSVDPSDPNLFSFSMQTVAGTIHGRSHDDDEDE